MLRMKVFIFTLVGKQYKDSAYVHVSDLSLTIIKLSYVIKSGTPL